jgi:hypothetical protein
MSSGVCWKKLRKRSCRTRRYSWKGNFKVDHTEISVPVAARSKA